LFLLWSFSSFIIETQSQQLTFKSFLVELWPEYDRPDVLVIYRAELDPVIALPARLTLRLPDYIEQMNAVAFEENGLLKTIDQEAMVLRHEGEAALLTLTTPSPKIQIEYYDPVILTKQGQQRRLDYSFMADYSIETVTFEIQEPAQTQEFSLAPEPDRTFTDNNGLEYNILEITGLAPGEVITLTATYQRPTDELSTQLLGFVSEHAPDVSAEPAAPVRGNITLAYILAGTGLIIFLGAIGHWWFSRRKIAAASRRRPTGRPVRHRKQPAASQPKTRSGVSSPAGQGAPGFCYKCGTALRPEANFCHACGAERRRE
jgi:hypothetical protein